MKTIRITSNVLIVCGLACLAVAGWWIHPAVGMLVVGASLLVIGFSIGLTIKAKATDK